MRERLERRWPPALDRPRGGLASGVAALCIVLLACGSGGGAEAGSDSDGTETPARPPPASPTGQESGSGAESSEPPAVPGSTRIVVGGHPVTVEVADEEPERQRGLMHRESLPEDHGMLFVYPAERYLSFWMRNTLIPLDVAFIDATGRIVDIQQMEAQSDESHTTRAPAMYALEMRIGWFGDHEVEIGDAVEF